MFNSHFRRVEFGGAFLQWFAQGTLNYEIGDAALKNEKNFEIDLSARYATAAFALEAAMFRDHFDDYIYLAPTTEQIQGFRVYRFLQTEANLKGLEASLDWIPPSIGWLDFRSTFSQDNLAPPENASPGYTLVDLALGGNAHPLGRQTDLTLLCRNLFSTVYYDHFSRLTPGSFNDPTIGFNNIGRNICLYVGFPFDLK